MNKTFIVATDGSENARQAEQYTLRTLDPGRDRIIVAVASDLHLFLQISKWKQKDRDRLSKKAMKNAEDVARQTAQRFRKGGFEVDYEVLYSPAGPGICDLAKREGADGIFIGRQGRNKIKEVLMGSVSSYVVHHAPCAVTIVPVE